METHSGSIDEQIELETTQVTWGVERYMEAKAKAEARSRDMDAGPVSKLMYEMMDAMLPRIKQEQKEQHAKVKLAVTRGVRLGGWELAFVGLPAEVLAYITCRSVLTAVDRERDPDKPRGSERHNIASRIGQVVNHQFRWDAAQTAERDRLKSDDADPRYNRLNRLRKTVKEINPRFVRRWLKKLDDLQIEGLDRKSSMQLGANLFDILQETCGEYIEIVAHRRVQARQSRTFVVISYTEATRAKLEAAHVRTARAMPWLLPMVAQPLDWKLVDDQYVGGYFRTPLPIIKYTGGARHTDTSTLDGTITALNAIQRTAWKIDEGMLALAVAAIEAGREDLLPVGLEHDLPESIPAEVYARMTKEEQDQHRTKRRAVHDHNNKMRAKREAMFRQVSVADNFVGRTIYFPHNMDFRGRVYPLPQDLHPQADDFGRSLLTFAEGKPLGSTGLKWLVYHCANTYGLDKEDRDAQYKWVQENSTEIALAARYPFDSTLVGKAEEPWQFIAACRELDAALASGKPEDFISYLPVQVDGTCNGLQHLSAMGLDPVGAVATNLTPGPRQDIYQQVADKVIWEIENRTDPTHGGKTWDSPWLGHVTRKTVKRGVMTMPYGLTPIGMKDQLIADGHCAGLDGDIVQNANEMKDLMLAAIEDTVVAAAETMAWLQFNAKQLAQAGKPIQWTTPTGMVCRQEYVNQRIIKMMTVAGRMNFYMSPEDATPRVSKQVTAIAPNVIHSFDAAHMYLTVDRAVEEGLSSFSMIHDSYGSHAADMDTLSSLLRETFVDIYSHDWFASMQAEFEALAGDEVELAPPPARGDFDITQVLNSNFFFA